MSPDLSPHERPTSLAVITWARVLGFIAGVLALGAVVAVVVGADLAAVFQAICAAIFTIASLWVWRAAVREE